jgi:hypothetical protein
VNSTIPARVRARSRNDDRLQSMTLGAAAIGIVATGFFGYAAALTYAGTTTSNASTTTQGGLTPQQLSNSYSYNGSDDGQQGGATNPYYNQQQIIIPPVSTGRHAHASSGGS